MKDTKNHNKLVIDDLAANVVRDIFKWRIEGLSNQGIANRLNDMGVLSPYEYKRANGQRFSTAFKTGSKAEWSAVAVSRTLKNEVYLGVLEQARKTSKRHKIKVRTEKTKNEWIRFENAHEPIISNEDWNLVRRSPGSPVIQWIPYSTRELKKHGVYVIFLNDGIDTRDSDSELRLSIMAP